MTTKQKILATVQTMPDDVSIDDVIDRLSLIRKIDIARQQADRGEGIEHDALMQDLLGDDEQD